VQEFRRVLRPGGTLIVNVPRPKPRSLITRTRDAIGLTDAWHGHVRPGYTEESLRALLAPSFSIEVARTYSKAFSEAIDTALNGLYEKLRAGGNGRAKSRKGTVVTGADMKSHRKAFKLMSVLHPVLWSVAKLDALLVGQTGFKLIVRARLTDKPDGPLDTDERLEQVRDIAPATFER
jgi:hypothetical protein